jgi:hypothetical protein
MDIEATLGVYPTNDSPKRLNIWQGYGIPSQVIDPKLQLL